MSKHSREKGKRGEREAAHEIKRLFRCQARRGVQFQGGTDSPDLYTDIPGVHFEVKRVERLEIHRAMQQAIADAGENVPVVLHRANGKPWLVVCRLDDLPRLVTQLYLTLAS